jgi:hypothetical protein
LYRARNLVERFFNKIKVALPRIFCAEPTFDIVRAAKPSAPAISAAIEAPLALVDFKSLGRNRTTGMFPS